MGIVEYCKMFVTIVPGCGIRTCYIGRYIFVYPAPKKKDAAIPDYSEMTALTFFRH